MKHFLRMTFLGILLLSLMSSERQAAAQPSAAGARIHVCGTGNGVCDPGEATNPLCPNDCSWPSPPVGCAESAKTRIQCASDETCFNNACVKKTVERKPTGFTFRSLMQRATRKLEVTRGVVPSPIIGDEGTEAKILTPPNPSSVADLVDQQAQQEAQQKCADRYLQCFRECSNGTEPLIKADDPDLAASCQKVMDPKNTDLVCYAKFVGCYLVACNGHQNPLNEKASGYLGCLHDSADSTKCAPTYYDFANFVSVDTGHFLNDISVGLFVKAVGRKLEANGCEVMDQDLPLANCVTACWGAPYGGRCNQTTIRMPDVELGR